MRAQVLATGLAVLGLVVVGCGQADPGPRPDPTEDAATGPESTGPPPTLPPEFLECDSERYSDDGTVLLADVDLTQADWDTPADFAEAHDYIEEHPPADQLLFWVAEPQPPAAPNALGVSVHGGLDWTGITDVCARIPHEAVVDWLADFHQDMDIQALEEPEGITVADQEGVQQVRQFTDRTSRATWVFSQEHVLVVYCQWTDTAHEQIIEDGCTELLESVRLP